MTRARAAALAVVALLLAAGVALLPGPRDWLREQVRVHRNARTLQAKLPAARLAESVPGASASAPDIVVIVLDTLRRDAVGVYRDGPSVTPRMDAWAREARIFEQARTTAPWTLPAHASLLTGRDFADHGVGVRDAPGGKLTKLADGIPTLAGALREVGYATVGIAANRIFLQKRWRIQQGFDVWLTRQLVAPPGRNVLDAEEVTDLALEVLHRERGRPLLLFLNYMDAHAPWYEGPHANGSDGEPFPYDDDWRVLMREAAWGRAELPPSLREAWRAAYDDSVAYLDEHVGRLLAELPAAGVGPEDLVVITSDHGEYLGEHGLLDHGMGLYEEMLSIPLLVRGPGFPAGRDSGPVQINDVAHWAVAAAGARPLAAPVRDDVQIADAYYSEFKPGGLPPRFERMERSFVRGHAKLVVGSDGSEVAFDLSQDPGESQPLESAPWLEELRRRAVEYAKRSTPVGAPVELGEDEQAELRALGYAE